MKKYKVAIVGATGAVGREMLRCIFQFHFPFESLKLLASARSAGKVIEYEGHEFVVEELTENSFEGIEVAFWSAGGSISEKYKDLYQIAKKTFASEKLSSYVVFSGLLAGTTMIFVWSFQPLMKAVGIPVTLFGVVYFINHFIRAAAGYFLHKIVAFFTLKRLGEITYVLFFAAFGVALLMTKLNHPPLWVSFAMLTFICIVIGFQLSFTLGSVSRIHSIVSSDIRATVSSLNTMFSRLMSGFFLILFKFLLDGTIGSSYFIYIAILCFGAIPLLKLLRIQDRTNESEATNNQPS